MLSRSTNIPFDISTTCERLGLRAQVAIVLFRTLVEFYDTPLGLGTLPLMMWRFAIIGIGSILTGSLKLPYIAYIRFT